jgi:hypothetical protein
LHDGLLKLVHFLLRFEEVAGDRIVQKNFAILLELPNLFIVQGHAKLLLLLERVTFFRHELILGFCRLVGEKCVHTLTNGTKLRLIDDDLAELFRLLNNDAVFDGCLQDVFSVRRGGSVQCLCQPAALEDKHAEAALANKCSDKLGSDS